MSAKRGLPLTVVPSGVQTNSIVISVSGGFDKHEATAAAYWLYTRSSNSLWVSVEEVCANEGPILCAAGRETERFLCLPLPMAYSTSVGRHAVALAQPATVPPSRRRRNLVSRRFRQHDTQPRTGQSTPEVGPATGVRLQISSLTRPGRGQALNIKFGDGRSRTTRAGPPRSCAGRLSRPVPRQVTWYRALAKSILGGLAMSSM